MCKILSGCIAFLVANCALAGAVDGPQVGANSGGAVKAIRFEGGQPAVLVVAISGGGNVRVYDAAGQMVKREEARGPNWDIVWVTWTPDQTEQYRIEIGASTQHVFKTN